MDHDNFNDLLLGENNATRKRMFLARVMEVAYNHRAYLLAHGLAIEACYKLELTNQRARLYVEPSVPLELYEELQTCFARIFS
ncbi:hypothetical protein P1X16_25730 [Hymenobacter sp. YC55]|nr:hypothetical protein [Hymenobacter sp. YC55]